MMIFIYKLRMTDIVQMKLDRRQSEIIEQLFTYRNVDELEEYLSNQPGINIARLIDSQGNNVLHQLAYEGHIQLIKLFVRKVVLKIRKQSHTSEHSSRETEQKQFRFWINQKNNQGFTPLLYAAYNGHLDIIRYLVEEHRADYRITTNTGLNPFHLAAQKNILMPFLYFRNHLNLYDLDELKSSPLHWAAYTNSEEVLAFILAETQDPRDLNLKDTEGNTPLSLAVSYGNTRVVRRLLIRGANRYIQNGDEKIPLEIARQSEFKTISRMLNEQFSIADMLKFYCNIKIEYKPKGRQLVVPLLFIVSFIVNLGVINVFLIFTDDITFYAQIAFMAIMLAYYLSLLCQTPKNERRSMQSLLEEYTERNIRKVCFICRNKVPKRGYHCDVCGVCIEQYDHHCTWINNCVGKKNIARFIIFIVMLVLSLAFIGILSVLATISLIYQDFNKFDEYFIFRYSQQSDLERYCVLGCFLVCEVSSVFLLPVCMLCLVQIKNLLTNKTTFEKMRGPSQEPNRIKSRYRNGKVSLRNCRVMCTDTRNSFVSTTRSSYSQLLTDSKFPSEKQQLDHRKS